MDNIFDLPVEDQTPTIDEGVDYVDQLVGEGKKFKDVSALARGKAEADAYIERLKAELDNQKKELSTRMSLEDFLKAQKEQGRTVHEDKPIIPDGNSQNGLDEEILLKKVEEILARRDSQKAQETNLQRVSRVMTEQFGDRVGSVINSKAAELGMSREQLQSIATSAPEAFFRLVGATEGPRDVQTPVVPRSQINTLGQQGNNSVRNAKFYERMKVNDPARYNRPETVSEMIRDRAALGTKFYD